jgi:serine/threonine protein kinase
VEARFLVINLNLEIFLTTVFINICVPDFLVSHGKMTEPEARRIFHQIVGAVHYLHENHIVHRDLKAENLLLDAQLDIKLAGVYTIICSLSLYAPCYKKWNFKILFTKTSTIIICPFSQTLALATVFSLVKCSQHGAAVPHMLLLNSLRESSMMVPRQTSGCVSIKSELMKITVKFLFLQSLGVVLYVLVCGALPFDGETLQTLKARVIDGKVRIPFFMSSGTNILY